MIAYGKGGAAEIVKDKETGILFHEQSAESLIEAIERFQHTTLNNNAIKENATRFSTERFHKEFSAYFEEIVSCHKFI